MLRASNMQRSREMDALKWAAGRGGIFIMRSKPDPSRMRTVLLLIAQLPAR